MVLLTMTPSIVAAVQRYEALAGAEQTQKLQLDGEPQLSDPAPGKPISHAQLIDISDFLKARAAQHDDDSEPAPSSLNDLLRGSKIYVPPPPPKPEPSNEYKELMARLRKEEEARAYERMLNPPPPTETFSQRFPASNADLFAPHPMDSFASKDEDDEVTYADINRQLALIINVLVSIIACSVAIWIAARYWSTPARLALSMTGSGVVAVAEVAIYLGYLRRIKEAKVEEKKKPEIKEIAETWVIEGSGEKKSVAIQKTGIASGEADTVRHRKGKQK
ncbi:Vacuolar ATPase assembly integral membrane protein VPH2 [Lasiodiplodia hormozganensis]|uniref:Vacuolar ATPase assembly integral membrane protein VPH2 n=1 Tax=Lasiodiplodia hormozganensis TaxID=869390 RepID=A0AA40D3B0_9PEZI|nr:Vacuolar ATPase assembly integral membrane protein VPH2 [Lasiodiplodia hormozganensis]